VKRGKKYNNKIIFRILDAVASQRSQLMTIRRISHVLDDYAYSSIKTCVSWLINQKKYLRKQTKGGLKPSGLGVSKFSRNNDILTLTTNGKLFWIKYKKEMENETIISESGREDEEG